MNKLNALDVKQFIPGECFICLGKCDPKAYLHYQCGLAYYDEKEKRIKAANED